MEASNESRSAVCIFCLKVFKSTDDCAATASSESEKYKFLTLIIRHFVNHSALISEDKQEWCKHALKVIKEIGVHNDSNDPPGFEIIQICSNCKGITRKFSDLYHQIKELELRMDWEVQKLWDVMECVDRVATTQEKDELEKWTTSDGGGVTLGEFRKTLKQSCKAYQEIKEMAAPKVQLAQMIPEVSSLNGGKDIVDLQINSDFLSPKILEDEECLIVLPEVLQCSTKRDVAEYPTQPDGKGYSRQTDDQGPPVQPDAEGYPRPTDNQGYPTQPDAERYSRQPEVQEYPKQPEVQEYLTQTEGQGYPRQLEVDNQRETLAEELIVEHDENQNTDVVFPEQHVGVNCENDLSPLALSPLPAATALPLQEEDPMSPPNNSKSTYICTTCSLPFTSKFELFQHNMANHIGKYFLSVQPSELHNDQFNHFITNLLETTLDTFDKAGDRCPFCSDIFPGREKARNHLVVKHRSILKEKLVHLQKSESDPPQPQPRQIVGSSISTSGTTKTTLKRKGGWPKGKSRKFKPKPKYPKPYINCELCSMSFPKKSSLSQHHLQSHPEKDFVSVKLASLTPHQFQNCFAYLLKTTSDEFQKVNSQYQCIYCSKIVSVRTCAKNHLVKKHPLVLRKKLVDLQMSSDVNLVKNTSRRLSRRATFLKNADKHYSCKICVPGKVFKHGFLFNQHLSYYHPEIFFERSNLLPASSENEKQFKTYVQYVLEQQIGAPVSMEGDRIKCGICPKVLSSMHFAKTHLILRHQFFLEEKLKDVQNSGISLQEIEDELVKMKGTRMVGKKSPQAAASDLHATPQNSGNVPLPHSNTRATLLKRKKINNGSHPACNVCRKIYTNEYVLIRHQTWCHPEIFFQDEKPAEFQKNSEGDQLFKKYVSFIVERQVDEEFSKRTGPAALPDRDPLEGPQPSVAPMGGRDNVKYQCNLCFQELCNRYVARTHLIIRHRSNIVGILEGLNGKTVEEIKLESMHFETKCPVNSLKRKGGWPKGRSRLLKRQSTTVGGGNLKAKRARYNLRVKRG